MNEEESVLQPTFPLSPIVCSLTNVTNRNTNAKDCPESYRSNSEKEELILTYAENFRRQYHHIYRDRKPLFLCPTNECGIPKLVCTSIRPTVLPYSDLIEWKSTADFIADHLNYDPLKPAYELPIVLSSSTKVLAEQRGHSFEYAHLLCSLLIGVGYDAYVVSGYATREICYMDTTRLPNPHTRTTPKKNEKQQISRCEKYPLKPPKDLTSKYDSYMHQRYLDRIRTDHDRAGEEEDRRIADIEKPLPDPLDGLRVHGWVLVLPGKRDVTQAFFIEPTTGYGKATDDREYLGIESVWNHRNLWVNMQDCSTGCQSLEFNLDDQNRWEAMFPSPIEDQLAALDDPEEKSKQVGRKRPFTTLSNHIDWFDTTKFYFNNPLQLPVSNIQAISYHQKYPDQIKSEILRQYYRSTIPDLKTVKKAPRDLDQPPSWVDPLDISSKNFQRRYPNGRKRYFFKKTSVEKYAPYSVKDGLVLKVSEFQDYDVQEYLYVTFYYEHRHDKLDRREHDLRTNIVSEYYRAGRKDRLKEYRYDFEPLFERTMIYYHKARLDGLFKRQQTASELTAHFLDRDDFLEYRKTIYDERVQASPSTSKDSARSIFSITERFTRNPALTANDDVQELIYAIRDEQFLITYHRDHHHITASIRVFHKPSNWRDKGFELKWFDAFETTYQADEEFPQLSKRDLYHKLIDLLRREEKVIQQVREAENEIRALQSHRQQEEISSDLEVTLDDIERNEKSKIYRKLLQDKINNPSKVPDDIDYLAPFLAALGSPEQINRHIAEQLRHTVLQAFKDRALRRANAMQTRYENDLAELLRTQQRYETHAREISTDDVLAYRQTCQQSQFRLQVLTERLQRHNESFQREYDELEYRLKTDARLKEPYRIR